MLILATLPALMVSSALAQDFDTPEHSFLFNTFSSVRVIDSFALATTDFGLLAMSFDADRIRFAPLNHLLLPSQPSALKIYGDVAAVRSWADVVYFVDISSLPDLTLLGTADPGLEFEDFALSGQDLYLAVGFEGVFHYEMTAYNNAVFADSSQRGVHVIQVETSDGYLYALDDYNGLLLYDISGGNLNNYDNTLWLPKQAYNFALTGTDVYVPLLDYMQMFVGTFAGASPSITDTIDLLGYGERVFITDDYLSILLEDHTMDLRLLSDRANPWLWLTLADGLMTDGLAFTADSRQLLTLPDSAGGMVGYELDRVWPNYQPIETYTRPGPITALTLVEGRLHTGGTRNPYEVFSIGAQSTPTLDTAYSYLSNVTSIVVTDVGMAVAQESPNVIRILAFSNDSIQALDVRPTGDFVPEQMMWRQLSPSDTVSGLFVAGDSTTLVYQVDATGSLTQYGYGRTLGRIQNMTIVDTTLILADQHGQLYGYRVFDNYSLEARWTVTAPEPITSLIEITSDTVFMFAGEVLYTLSLADGALPSVAMAATYPVDVNACVLSGDTMYTCGDRGVGAFDLTVAPPLLIANGGYGGDLIAAQDSVLVVSDGRAVHLYSINSAKGGSVVESNPDETANQYRLTNYPNPFNPRTSIAYDLPANGPVSLTVYNTLGQRVAVLVDEHQAAGPHTVEWDGIGDSGDNLATGIYLYRLTTANSSVTRKMVLLK